MKNLESPFFITSIFIFIMTTLNSVVSQTTLSTCILDIHIQDSNCAAGNWGGFLDTNCCTEFFDEYLRALALRANQTGQLFLNAAEQKHCLTSFETVGKDVLSCGIEKLTRGNDGCSEYSVTDVVNNLGNMLGNLNERCGILGSGKIPDLGCGGCLRRWEEIDESEVCRFAVLVTLTSKRISDEKWIQAVYKCLGEQNFSADGAGGAAKKKTKLSTGIWILIAGLAIVAVIVLIAAWIMFKRRTKETSSTGKDVLNNSISGESRCLKINIKEVYSATNNLNALNFIGQGIAGKVYKGILSNGQRVAVKHIINDGQVETFIREVRSLSHVRHPNLVALLGYCEEEDECFLLYELCHNGNLSEWLFGKEKEKVLSWIQRLEIAVDCARGLWFLHTYPEGCIVHRDIKPTNILIGANFQAKLSDFGLSKVMDVGQSFVSSEVRGTFGYVDPEYRKNRHVNALGDVYSFGIVLLQLLSGQRVINLNSNRPMSLDKTAKFLNRGGKIAEFADPKLRGEYSVDAFDLVLKLALSCSGFKQQRPSMEEVVLKLEKAIDISIQVNISHPPTHFMD